MGSKSFVRTWYLTVGSSQALSPLLKEGCHRLMYSVILSCNRSCSGLGQKQTLWFRSAGFHVTARCLEEAELEKQSDWRCKTVLLFRAAPHLCVISCKCLLPGRVVSKNIHTCQQAREAVQVTWCLLACFFSQRSDPPLQSKFVLAAEVGVSLIFWRIHRKLN